MYYPRLRSLDRLRGRIKGSPRCGAAAGLLSRAEGESGLAASAEEERRSPERAGLQPACEISAAQRLRLALAGLNTLSASRTGAAGGGQCAHARGRRRRFARLVVVSTRGAWALRIAASVERGTRWMALRAEHSGHLGARAARWSMRSSRARLAAEGAFAGDSPDERYFVVCDERINHAQSPSLPVRSTCCSASRRAAPGIRRLAGQPPAGGEPRPPGVGQSPGDAPEPLQSGGARMGGAARESAAS